jgi:hypothetical protein
MLVSGLFTGLKTPLRKALRSFQILPEGAICVRGVALSYWHVIRCERNHQNRE